MNRFTSMLPSLVSALIAVLGLFSGDVQAYISAHPAIAASLAALYAILNHILPSPRQPQ